MSQLLVRRVRLEKMGKTQLLPDRQGEMQKMDAMAVMGKTQLLLDRQGVMVKTGVTGKMQTLSN